ncbi:MAG: sugar phosphate isomerase/epimerase [Rhizobiales bacterium]|nr:sugar phosphate isomerase/epimerase [Hyphomicrobiales bacterium]
MKKPEMKFGCQTFTWEMLGAKWTGGPDDLVRAIADGGYEGIEITDTMIGSYAGRAGDFARRLNDAGLTLVSFAFGSSSGFTEPARIDDDLEAARRWAGFAAHFQGAMVSMGSATIMSAGARHDKFGVAADVYNRATEIGRAAGVAVAVHPSSHHNTLLFDRADYDQIFALLDPQVGWVPDTGHILRGGQSLGDTLAAHRHRIRYVHLKDVDARGNWAMLGKGLCDITAAIAAVSQAPRFNGWIVVEEESDTAASDPAAAVRANLETLRAFSIAGANA